MGHSTRKFCLQGADLKRVNTFSRLFGWAAALSLVILFTAGPVSAQTEPDFGDPPETLIQDDGGEGFGRELGAPTAVETQSRVDATTLLILGGAIAIILSLAGVTYATSKRRRSEIPDPTDERVGAAQDAIRSTRTLQQLATVVAAEAHDVTTSHGVFVIIDGAEAEAGRHVEVSSDLVVRVEREQAMVKYQAMSVAPVISSGTVVGLVAIDGGNSSALNALAQFASAAYAPAAAKKSRFAGRDNAAESDTEVDGLTGVGNRRRFNADLASVLDETESEAAPVSLAMFDVDNFHYYNEAHGKQAGNDVLRSIAELIAANLRESDVVYRYSGVQFVALLPGATVDNAFVVVERIREAVQDTGFAGEEVQPSGRVTLSIGIAEAPSDQTGDLVSAAGHALSLAKESGRNRVVIEADIR